MLYMEEIKKRRPEALSEIMKSATVFFKKKRLTNKHALLLFSGVFCTKIGTSSVPGNAPTISPLNF